MRRRKIRDVWPRPGAFTLIEVLISLAIFALAAVVLAAAYLNVLSAYQSVAQRHQGEEGWKLVRSAILLESEREKIEEGGRVQLGDRSNVNWKATIDPTELADLFSVTVTIEPELTASAEGRAREQKLMLLRPGWSEAAEKDKLRQATQQRLTQNRKG